MAFSLLIIPLIVAGASGSGQVQSEIQKPHDIVVTGCLDGRTLKTTRADNFGTSADTFRLRGSRQVMKALREYQGHELQITGTLKDREGRMGATRTKALSRRTKLSLGVREDRNTQQPEDPELTVESFKVVSASCRR